MVVADRNPSKQRRQAQNRAAREARKARSEAANTPVEDRRVVEEPKADRKRRSRRERAKVSREEVEEQARAVIEASAVEDEGFDRGSLPEPEPTAEPVAARRGSSSVFSARHRAAVADATAGRAPARTHHGVVEATGVVGVAPAPVTRSSTGSGGSGGSVRKASRNDSTRSAAATRSSGSSSAKASRSRPGAGASRPAARGTSAKRNSSRPPAKPLPPFLDRFGGNEPGGRWVMLSFATVLIASIVVNFVHIVPEIVETGGKKVQTGKYFTIWHYGIGPGLYFLLPPIVILGLFIFTARPWDRRRSWNFALALLVFITFVSQSISIFMVPIALLGWGCWQARKAALEEVGGDPRVLREVERERRAAGKEALREQRRR